MNPPEPPAPTTSTLLQFTDFDLVIRISDNVDFTVHKNIMSFASGTFKDMISLDHSSSTSSPERRVEVAEDSAAIGAILRYIYPLPRPVVADIWTAVKLLNLADKYNIPNISNALEEVLLKGSYHEEDLVLAYVVSKKYQMDRLKDMILPLLVQSQEDFDDLTFYYDDLHVLSLDDILSVKFYRELRAEKAFHILKDFSLYGTVPPCKCRARRVSITTTFDCFAWRRFVLICEHRLKRDPMLNILDPSLREEAAASNPCPHARDNLFGSYGDLITYGKRRIGELPWIFPTEFEAEKARLRAKYENWTDNVVFRYNT
ncbi:hypothetical protein SISNIDRAFT_498587 [Sistotremastrum niveocremeum HHB9708]|uniref:BTB domain-containing protein n=2 Tax=Sistotremastraceae TaxID=3402574 RepID=A0A164MWQ9_9AGAM|nr:hypothetical protein SISNIDRAFT_498587 [Sistotremastrum niveocremeum HHB9708]KZT32462.1 hypothetical protein SISSUDRAFT_1133141 [Sistotremastrum suecicum HHB10207 ss-3]